MHAKVLGELFLQLNDLSVFHLHVSNTLLTPTTTDGQLTTENTQELTLRQTNWPYLRLDGFDGEPSNGMPPLVKNIWSCSDHDL